jgi:hypothetical protein
MAQGRAVKPDKNISTSLALSPDVLGIVDGNRGQCSRSKFINDLVLKVFSGSR